MQIIKIIIKTLGQDFKSEVETRGTLEESGGEIKLRYKIDGDDCVLTYKDKTVTQIRRGSENLALTFKENRTSLCTVGLGDMQGSFETTCEKITFTRDNGGIEISLKYDCGGGETFLTLSARYEQERK